ncbi:DNA cytosine methyltransferase [Lentzea kentuckyensis]|uniref:DNA cytosine methyltransferase n=1 Tax=Lentzea kentuckyensis TaxID=360086 RepID=UPI000A368023|nr:DNA cytosine methyltransferase [Lentzea kentuckyensis]
MPQPRLLDLFCCGGGAAVGYQRAGYHVTGVDIRPQPRYAGHQFHQADALDYLDRHGHEYDAIHASPPCQRFSRLNAYNQVRTYPDLITPIRRALRAQHVPYVIENVETAHRELINPVKLCGTMFGLKIYRHRLFETNFPVPIPEHPRHVWPCTRNSYLPTPDAPYMSIHGGKHSHTWQSTACQYMDLPHLDVTTSGATIRDAIREICEAIPPAYTHHIGAAALNPWGATETPAQLTAF